MTHQLVTKTVAGLPIPCLILSAVGCSTYQTVDLKDAESDEHLIVGTKGDHYFRFVQWTADSLGNVTGRGGECASLADAESSKYQRGFDGNIPADSIAVILASRYNIEGTTSNVTTFLVIGLLVVGIVVAIVAISRIELAPSF